jgi:hypothetical protein
VEEKLVVNTPLERQVINKGDTIKKKSASICYKDIKPQIFSVLQKLPGRLWGPLSVVFNRYRGSFPVIKRPEREVEYLHSSSVEVQNKWSYTSTLPMLSSHGHRLHFSTLCTAFWSEILPRRSFNGAYRMPLGECDHVATSSFSDVGTERGNYKKGI